MIFRGHVLSDMGLRMSHALTIMLLGVAVAVVSMPKGAEAVEMYEQRKNFKLSASALYQLEANLDRGGDFNVNRYFFGLDWKQLLSLVASDVCSRIESDAAFVAPNPIHWPSISIASFRATGSEASI